MKIGGFPCSTAPAHRPGTGLPGISNPVPSCRRRKASATAAVRSVRAPSVEPARVRICGKRWAGRSCDMKSVRSSPSRLRLPSRPSQFHCPAMACCCRSGNCDFIAGQINGRPWASRARQLIFPQLATKCYDRRVIGRAFMAAIVAWLSLEPSRLSSPLARCAWFVAE